MPPRRASRKGRAYRAGAQANTKQKFAALLHKLTAKFPKMIRQIKDPQQAYFENIMKEAERKKEAAPDVVDGVEEDEDVEDLDASDEL